MRTITARWTQKCRECSRPVEKDSEAAYDDDTKQIYHPECSPEEPEQSGKTGAFSAKTDGYRRPEKSPDQIADDLGFDRNGDLK